MNKKPPSAARKTTTTRRPVSVSARTSPADDLRSALRALVPAAFPGGDFRPDELAKILSAPTHPDAASDAGGRGGWGGWGGWEGDDGVRYRFDWAGRREAFARHAGRASGTLAPDLRRSADFFAARNVYIEAENLEALKILSRAYAGRVKMIYIDPPYNTGNDFVYNDKFAVGSREYMAAAGMLDGRGRAKSARAREEVRMMNGHKHSAWLTMMWPRLMAARSLLADDGVIFVSIDDNEVHHLRLVMNMVFGEENFIGDLVVVRSEGGGMAKHIVKGHDYVLAFAKRLENFAPLKRDKDIRGKIVKVGDAEYWLEEDWLRKKFGEWGTCHYEEIVQFKGEDKKREIDAGIASGKYRLVPKKNGLHSVARLRKVDGDGSKFYSILKHLNANGIRDLQSLGMADYFPFPKPVSLAKELIKGATFDSLTKDDIILDFFSGSATTAHAVMELNAEDGGKRRCLSVQFPEPTLEESPARKAGFRTIADIGRERLIRAGKKIRESQNGKMFAAKTDTGFRFLRWTESALGLWPIMTPKDGDKKWMEAMEMRRKLLANAEPLSLLTEVMLREGCPLCARIEEISAKDPDGKMPPSRVFRVTDPESGMQFYFCPEPAFPLKIGDALGLGRDDLFICREDAMTDSVAATISRRHRLRVF